MNPFENLPHSYEITTTIAGKEITLQCRSSHPPEVRTLPKPKIGFITGMTLHTTRFRDQIYALTKFRNEKGHHYVQAYMWEKDKPETQWFTFRSARQAHTIMKRRARKRRWSDNV